MCSDAGPLSGIVPTDGAPPAPLAAVAPIVVQSLPTVVVLLAWIAFGVYPRRRGASDRVRAFARIFALGVALATTLVAARLVAVLACELGYADQSLLWSVLAGAAHAAVSVVVVGALAPRVWWLAVLASFALAAGAVVVDVGVRGWWTTTPLLAAQHLMPLQHAWALHAAALLVYLPRAAVVRSVVVATPRASIDVRRAPTLAAVDALARRGSPSRPRCASSERGRERSNLIV